MIDPKRLAGLARMAALRKDADLMALAAETVRRTAADDRLRALDTAAVVARSAAEGNTDPAFLAAQEGFARWVAARRSVLTQDLDIATSRVAVERARAARSFGRCQALDATRTRLAEEMARRSHRRDGGAT
ncbi:MAG: hypothetical protein B7Z02_15065 [Rhodobacterales bacterium 32-67-9]|nr:MAG: hypothetical protein B7Z02_15065 [Rhodobacterales bacterium 32-67-9]